MAGHSRPKDGVASARVCPATFSPGSSKNVVPGIADQFMQPAQGRLLRQGMTTRARPRVPFRLTIGLHKVGNEWRIAHEQHSVPATDQGANS
jgi:hypothetical protein